MDLQPLLAIIKQVAREELVPRFAKATRSLKADGSIVTEADLIAQQRISDALAQLYPDYDFLGEEMSPDQQQRMLESDKPCWCLDPLDGTSNFAAGISYFCVSLSLIEDGKVKLAVVYDPMRDEMFAADENGATLNGEPLVLQDSGLPIRQSIALVDLKRLKKPLQYKLVDATPYASQRSFGSVALDWCWLAAGRVHLYLHGRSNIWDYGAGNYIFTQAGGRSCTLDGEPVFVAAMTPRSCVGAVDQSLFAQWCEFLDINEPR
ncbi:MAG: inositol monophosphatase family protein [Gammaproteobacteria bacterium]|nr:inositol monophosphatase family protein [Gammaproteobacteria bacterium]